MLMYVRQYAGASTTRSETLGSCRRGSVEACRVPEMAFASAPWPAIIRSSMVDWSRPTSNSHASGYAFRTSSVAGSQFSLRTREMELRSEEHTSELQSRGHLVCRLLLEKKTNRH